MQSKLRRCAKHIGVLYANDIVGANAYVIFSEHSNKLFAFYTFPSPEISTPAFALTRIQRRRLLFISERAIIDAASI